MATNLNLTSDQRVFGTGSEEIEPWGSGPSIGFGRAEVQARQELSYEEDLGSLVSVLAR